MIKTRVTDSGAIVLENEDGEELERFAREDLHQLISRGHIAGYDDVDGLLNYFTAELFTLGHLVGPLPDGSR